jgi:hypothetical protein
MIISLILALYLIGLLGLTIHSLIKENYLIALVFAIYTLFLFYLLLVNLNIVGPLPELINY